MIDVVQDENLGCIYSLERNDADGNYIVNVFEHFDSAVSMEDVESRVKDINGSVNGIFFLFHPPEQETGTLFKLVHCVRLGKVFPSPQKIESATCEARQWILAKREAESRELMDSLEKFCG